MCPGEGEAREGEGCLGCLGEVCLRVKVELCGVSEDCGLRGEKGREEDEERLRRRVRDEERGVVLVLG